MRVLSRSLALALIGLMWGSPFSLRQAMASMPMRAIILFDISGSMLKNDPERLSQAAAKLFLALAGSQDMVGLVAFSDQGMPIMAPTPLHYHTLREWLQAQMDGLQFTGQTTNLAAALEAGLASFPAQQDNTTRDLALLLTDGKLDLGPQRRAEEPAMLHHIRQTLLPQYKQRGIALYTIAFTAAADQALLQEMAQGTAGEFRFIHSAKGLHEAFQELFQVARQAESLPLTDNAFLLDDSITEASLVVSKKTGQQPLSLITPHQEHINANSTLPGVTWTSTPAYDLVQFVDPTPGKWQIEGEEQAAASVALVGHSTLRLQVRIDPAYREVGEDIFIRASLEDEEQHVQDLARLPGLTVLAEVTAPHGETRKLSLMPHDDGVFAATLPGLQEPGRYQVRVTATGSQLQRQLTLAFVLHPLCFQAAVDQGPPLAVSLTLAATCPALRALEGEAGMLIGQQPSAWVPLVAREPGGFSAALPPYPSGQTAEAVIRLRGALADDSPFTLVKGPWPLPLSSPPPAPQPAVILGIVQRVLLINGLLVLIAGSGYGFYAYRKKQRDTAHG